MIDSPMARYIIWYERYASWVVVDTKVPDENSDCGWKVIRRFPNSHLARSYLLQMGDEEK